MVKTKQKERTETQREEESSELCAFQNAGYIVLIVRSAF